MCIVLVCCFSVAVSLNVLSTHWWRWSSPAWPCSCSWRSSRRPRFPLVRRCGAPRPSLSEFYKSRSLRAYCWPERVKTGKLMIIIKWLITLLDMSICCFGDWRGVLWILKQKEDTHFLLLWWWTTKHLGNYLHQEVLFLPQFVWVSVAVWVFARYLKR